MKREEIVKEIIDCGAVAVIRMQNPSKLLKAVEALYEGGVNVFEITMTVPDALGVIEKVSREVPNKVIIGVGSVLNSNAAENSINAGAKFVVSPILKKEIIDTAHNNNLPVFPGAFTPTEIQTAYEWGADIVKVFPANIVGMKYFKSIKAPLPHLKLMPTGGVTLTNAGEWLLNGAEAVGIGSALLDKEAIEKENYSKLKYNAKILMKSIYEARRETD